MGDVNAKILRLALGFIAPDRSQQLPMGYDFAGILHEDAQERVFRWRELDLGALEFYLARREINAERTGVKDRLAGFGQGTSLGRAHARQQFGRVERLRDIVVRTSIERRDFLL